MKALMQVKVPRPRKDNSVRFKSGAGTHSKPLKAARLKVKAALKRGQEVFQKALLRSFEKPPAEHWH